MANTGSTWWAAPQQVSPVPAATAVAWSTHLVATWISADPEVTLAPPPIDLGALDLEPGASARLEFALPAPSTPGSWLLQLDIVDSALGSFAALGSVPTFVSIYVLPANDALDAAF